MTTSPWLRFYGAAGTVTGSKTLLSSGTNRVLVDCGMFQGMTSLRRQNWAPMGFDLNQLDAILITHAHLDHSGSLPLAGKQGFRGPIYCTEGTAELLEIMLRDAGKLQEEEAGYRNKRGWSKHQPALPLYTIAEVEEVLRLLHPVPFDREARVGNLHITFHPAEHIIGSAHILIRDEDAVMPSVLFSGDIGRGATHILFGEPSHRPEADVIVMESTYGDRRHPVFSPSEELRTALKPVLRRGGTALIPAFAVGRAQEILASLEEIFAADGLPRVPVYLDSPMAASALRITHACRDELSEAGLRLLESACRHTKVIHDANESKALNLVNGPAIIVSASGMLDGGRILHHLMARADRPNDALILGGYQAPGTRGRRLLDGESAIKIFGQLIEPRLEIANLTAFSAHADQEGLINWIAERKPPERLFLNHGEPKAMSALLQAIRTRLEDVPIEIAKPGVRYDLAVARA